MLPAAIPMLSGMLMSRCTATGCEGVFAATFGTTGFFGVDALVSTTGFFGFAELVFVATGGSTFTGLVAGLAGLVVFVVIY